ncbi:aminoacyl-tRNA hydrolase [Thiotrichales bacterium 19S3-7]|nr:aminoacyl-tRNA hydrolase [Thiotrichales bacterium 19S3-7]MCF6802471.1 aminoacyl-tRNA hydrolase [Thiotrichales bacterium 19S3-11]
MIKLIVGLGNPTDAYLSTRHNAGQWLLNRLSDLFFSPLKLEKKFFGEYARVQDNHFSGHLLFPTTYMNRSGLAVRNVCDYFNIKADEVLVIHDELDLPCGSIKLKHNGGHGGHNGLRDIQSQLGTDAFHRLRIGIGHPGSKAQVTPFVLSAPSKTELILINDAIEEGIKHIDDILAGRFDQAKQTLHIKPKI